MAARQWTPEQRRAQALRIRQAQPWRYSTGPITAAGKQRVAQNAKRPCSRADLRGLAAEIKRLTKGVTALSGR